jgi:hypothetical protein
MHFHLLNSAYILVHLVTLEERHDGELQTYINGTSFVHFNSQHTHQNNQSLNRILPS